MPSNDPGYDPFLKEQMEVFYQDFQVEKKNDFIIVISTKAGPLAVNIYDDWLACRFEDDMEKVKEIVLDNRLNKFSGKWNWHFFEFSDVPVKSKYSKKEIKKIHDALVVMVGEFWNNVAKIA